MSLKKPVKAEKSLQTKKEMLLLESMSNQELRQAEHDRLRKLEQERFSEEEILRLQSEALSSTKSSTESNVLIRVNYYFPPEDYQPMTIERMEEIQRRIAMEDKAKKTSINF